MTTRLERQCHASRCSAGDLNHSNRQSAVPQVDAASSCSQMMITHRLLAFCDMTKVIKGCCSLQMFALTAWMYAMTNMTVNYVQAVLTSMSKLPQRGFVKTHIPTVATPLPTCAIRPDNLCPPA